MGKKILDIGCGNAIYSRNLMLLDNTMTQYDGLDISEEQISLANKETKF